MATSVTERPTAISEMTRSTSGSSAVGSICIGTSPLSSRDSSSSCVDEAAQALGLHEHHLQGLGIGCSTPSARFSRWARIAVIGVFSSCETFATRSRRDCSSTSSSALIRLKAAAS